MGVQKCVCLLGLTCVLASQLTFGQDSRFAQIPAPNPDPFSLSVGSSFTASGGAPAPVNGGPGISKETIAADVEEALAIIKRSFAGNGRVTTEALMGSSIDSMLKVLDPHSNFYGAAEFTKLLGEHLSEYTGTGSSIAGFERDGQLDTFVVSTFPDSPAAKAGLRFGDKIVAVNGRNVRGESPDVVRDLVRGKRGTGVRLTIERPVTGAMNVELKRDLVHEPSVPPGFILNRNVGYIDMTNGFSNATFAELDKALSDLHRQGIGSLVLDLRGNGGGILDQAVKVAEKFLPAGSTILTQRGRTSADTRTWRAAKPRYETLPLVLLVDENTASAAEVLAGALQDNDRALIVGQKTFGKGLVQSVLDLPQGAGLTLTAARYFTPTGRSIQRDYSETGLYDYFNHRGSAAEIGKPLYAARTITGRTVYGGDGIAPDQSVPSAGMTPGRLKLLDNIFFFSREYLFGLPGGSRAPQGAPLQAARQKIIFGDRIVDDEVLARFREFLAASGSADAVAAANEAAFVRRMLGYYLAMGAFGLDAARREQVAADPLIERSISELPGSARLANAALKVRSQPRKEKSSLSLVLNERR
jgi:carboxyl-terminal processing protease